MERVLPPGSQEFGTFRESFARKLGDLEGASPSVVGGRQPRESDKRQAAAVAFEKSDEAIVPRRSAKTWVTPVESMEGRAEAKGQSAARNALPTQSGDGAPTILQRIRQRAKGRPEGRWTNLFGHLREPLLLQAYHSLRRGAATGVDGVTWEAYGERVDERLRDLVDRLHSGRYHPQPVRRVEIPKENGKTRPLGVPALEDKIVQQAVRWLLEPIYEAWFLGFSYGFRPKRSAHDALDAWGTAMYRRVNWVLDADILAFFDTIGHGWMQKFVEHRIGDRRLVCLLLKWMKAGVMKDGELHEVKEGTPQGGVISPLLANIYLHYVLDLWVQSWRKKHAIGDVYVVRYADDLVMGFQRERDARAMREALSDRMAKFGLKLHPEKTRVLEFGRYAREDRARRGLGKPETFEFLGFLHIAAKDRQGRFQLRRHTSGKKMRAKLSHIKDECRKRRHARVVDQHAWLRRVVVGHANYYAVPTNTDALKRFHYEVERLWYRSLARRSQRGRWRPGQISRFAERFPLPTPTIRHPWPTERFAARIAQGGSPVREIRSPGSVRGAT
ncbi:group II intron reverse transcriptase/maturase [Sorangium sp. So ce429]